MDLVKVKSSLLAYHPRPFSTEECLSPSVFTLRGPRRAGKTVTLKLLIAELIESANWNPRAILWTTFDTFRTLQQAEDHLVQAVQKYRPKLLLVDEVTALVGWQRVIKKLRDNGVLQSACLILTGSSAFDLKAGAERMAGRRGDAQLPDRVLLPMSYKDFVTQIHASLPAENNSMNGGPSGSLMKDFLSVGGFPFRVEKYLVHKKSGSSPWNELSDFQIFDDVFFYEFNRRRLDRSAAIEILGRLNGVGCGASSYEGFAKALSLSKDTARKYLDALGDSFLLCTYSSYDTSRNRVAPKKDRKFGWIDPSLGFLAKWLRQGTESDEAARAEWTVGAELLRRFEARLFEGLSAPRNVFTWKSSGGNEIDFLIVDKSKRLVFPVEVKYQNSISDWDFQIIERAFGKGVLVTPNFHKERIKSKAVSLEEFLLSDLLGESSSRDNQQL